MPKKRYISPKKLSVSTLTSASPTVETKPKYNRLIQWHLDWQLIRDLSTQYEDEYMGQYLGCYNEQVAGPYELRDYCKMDLINKGIETVGMVYYCIGSDV